MNVRTCSQESLLRPTPGDVGQKIEPDDDPLSFGAFDKNTRIVMVTVDTNAVRATFDGTAPNDSVGNYLPVGTVLWLSKEAATAAKFHHASAKGLVYGSPFTF